MKPAETAFDLAGWLAGEREEVEEALERALDELVPLLPEDVGAAVRHGVLGGGKRLRPILCMSAYRAAGGAPAPAAWDLAASLELVHAYSLVHDDLPCMDDAELRRGRPTTHRVHGERAAVRAGAALIPLAVLHARRAALALGRPPAAAAAIAGRLATAAGAAGMVGGQWLDLEGEGRALGARELDDLHARKTGALLAASLVMGGLAAGANDRVIAGLETYGAAIGLAFQIADDVLDATGSAEVLGKNPSDAALEKSTYVALYGLDEARRRARAQVDEALRALEVAGLRASPLVALARYVVERDR